MQMHRGIWCEERDRKRVWSGGKGGGLRGKEEESSRQNGEVVERQGRREH